MKRIIVYGLGQEWKMHRVFIEKKFIVMGYADKRNYDIENYVKPEELTSYEYDYIYITSSRYFEEIKKELIENLLISPMKIISKKDVFGDFENVKIRREWIIEKLRKIPAGKILLDAGAGECQYKPYCNHLRYIAQDFGKYEPNRCGGGGCIVINGIIRM